MDGTKEVEDGEIVKNDKGTDKSIRFKLYKILDDKRFHAVHLGLIVMDAILVLFLLLIDLDVIPVPGENEVDKQKNKDRIDHALHYTGLVFLILFMIEIIVRIILKKKEFFHDKLEVFDAVIVTLSLILDIALTSAPLNHAIRDGVLLLILLRLWRFFKLVCSINICVRKDVGTKLENERNARKKLEEENKQLREQIQHLKTDGTS